MSSFFEKLAKLTLKILTKEGIDKVLQKSKNRKEETKKSTQNPRYQLLTL